MRHDLIDPEEAAVWTPDDDAASAGMIAVTLAAALVQLALLGVAFALGRWVAGCGA